MPAEVLIPSILSALLFLGFIVVIFLYNKSEEENCDLSRTTESLKLLLKRNGTNFEEQLKSLEEAHKLEIEKILSQYAAKQPRCGKCKRFVKGSVSLCERCSAALTPGMTPDEMLLYESATFKPGQIVDYTQKDTGRKYVCRVLRPIQNIIEDNEVYIQYDLEITDDDVLAGMKVVAPEEELTIHV